MKKIDPEIASLIWNQGVIGLAKVGLDGTWLEVNPFLCHLLEYTESELADLTFQCITHPGDVEDDWEMVRKVISREIDSYVMAKRYITKTGNVIWIKLRVDAICGKEGQVVAFLSQVNPAVLVSSNSSIVQPAIQTFGTKVTMFTRVHWKWLIGATVAALGFFAQEIYKFSAMQSEIKHMQESISELRDYVRGK